MQGCDLPTQAVCVGPTPVSSSLEVFFLSPCMSVLKHESTAAMVNGHTEAELVR